MYKIRAFENLLLQTFSKGLISGTTHTYLGQEAISVSALSYLGDQDIVVSNHRTHGHFIAYCNEYKALLEEIKGTYNGVCRGMGGSQHLQFNNFYSNGVLGGTVPMASGMALAEKLKASNAIVVCFLGDGTMGEGVVYESFNMASLWKIPILFVVENNRYAQSTPVELNLAGSISMRVKAFNIETREIESNDINELLECFRTAFDYVRTERKPFCQIVHTYRLGPHSKGDDFRSEDEMRYWREKDPLKLARKYFAPSDITETEKRQEEEIKRCFESVFGKSDPDVLNGKKFHLDTDEEIIPINCEAKSAWINDGAEMLMANHLNKVLHTLMENNPNICIIGEDLLDPYGGAFKITKGLSTKFPSRVFSSPISEAGIVGMANGMALRDLVPVVEIMFGDFVTLIMDQIVNYATKFRRMYAEKVRCPVIVRTPMGGYRGYGPTHSQSLEKLFFGVPGLAVVACDPVHDQQVVWEQMLRLQAPCIYIENKLLYSQKLKSRIDGKIESFYAVSSGSYFPTIYLKITPFDEPADILILAYGGMTPLAMNVAKKLYIEDEIAAEVIIPSQISPLPKEDILPHLHSCRKVVVLEEGTQRNGWGSEIAALLSEKIDEKIIFRRCSALNTIIPNSKTEEASVLPSEQSCYLLIKEVLDAF